MKMRRISMAFGLLIFVSMTATISAQTGQAVGAGTIPNPLGVTAEQQLQIQDIVLKLQNELLLLSSSLWTKSVELQSLTANPNAEPSAVESKRKEVSDLQAEVQRKSLEGRNAIRSILTEEQKALFDQIGLGYGWGRGPCGLGLGAAWSIGFGGGRGFGRGRGLGWDPAAVYGSGLGVGGAGTGFYGPRWGRGPCGMGLGRIGWWR